MEKIDSLTSLLKVRRLMVLVFVFMGCFAMAFAQPRNFKMTAEGTIIDSKTSEPLVAATVKAVSADGGTGTFAITDSIGNFSLELERPGKYTLEFSYVGYKPLTKEVNVFPGRGGKLGNFKMVEDQTYLKEVETVARNQRVKQVGDTIEYNADAYKVRDGASAEELVAKMPGIEVTDEGVKAQGETVEKLLVDGKSFFENDPKLALKTLPAEVVQRVKVFDKKSDQAEFTGFDDGNTVKAMDLTTKAYRRNGVFGKVYGSLGNNFDFDNPYWNVGTNLNIFSGNRRFSILAMSNNVNQQNFTFDDLMSSGGMGGFMRGGFGGGGRMGNRIGMQAGVSRANAVSLNYNDSYLDDKLTIQGNYSFNNTRTEYHNETQTDNFGVYDSLLQKTRYNSSLSNTDQLSHNYNHSLDMNIGYKPTDRDEFIFRPSVTIQKSDSYSESTSNAWDLPLDSVMTKTVAMRKDTTGTSSNSRRLSTSDNTAWNVNGMLTWRHKFDKTGRTLSSMISGSVSGSESESNGINMGNAVRKDQWFQNNASEQNNWSVRGNLQYTEALGELSQLSVRYNVNYDHSDRDSKVGYDQSLDPNSQYYTYSTFMTGMDSLDAQNTSKYISKNLRQGGEIAYRIHSEKFNVMAGLNLEASRLEGEQDNYAWDTKFGQNPSFHTTLNYFSVLPNVRAEWNPWEGYSINMDYRARTSNPSIGNLQEVVNTSNPNYYSTGNKNLEQTTSHNIGLRLIHSNMETATNFMIFGNYSFESGHIGNETYVNYSNHELPLTELSSIKAMSAKEQEQYKGLSLRRDARFSRPVNLDGSKSAFLNASYGFPFDLLYSNVNLSVGGNYSESSTRQVYYNSYDSNTGKWSISDFSAKQRTYGLNPSASITSNISQDLDFSIRYNMSYNKTNNAVNTSANSETITQNASARLTWTFWKDMTMEHEVTYSYYGGPSLPEVVDECVWNVSLGKKILKKNAGEIKLQVYDLLQSRTGFSTNVSSYSITQSYTNFMPRYFMLTFSYKIQNYKSSSDLKERSGRGGFGGGFGGPGPRF